MRFNFNNVKAINAIAEDYKDGLGIRDLQAKYKISAGSIYRILDRKGIKRRSGVNASYRGRSIEDFSEEEINQLIQDRMDGYGIEEVIAKYGITKATYYNIWDQRNADKEIAKHLWELVED